MLPSMKFTVVIDENSMNWHKDEHLLKAFVEQTIKYLCLLYEHSSLGILFASEVFNALGEETTLLAHAFGYNRFDENAKLTAGVDTFDIQCGISKTGKPIVTVSFEAYFLFNSIQETFGLK